MLSQVKTVPAEGQMHIAMKEEYLKLQNSGFKLGYEVKLQPNGYVLDVALVKRIDASRSR